MSEMCDNMYSMCNSIIINVAWFVEQIITDLDNIRTDILDYDEENKPIENRGRDRCRDAGLLRPYKYVSGGDESFDKCEGDEDWLESWDKV